MRKTLTAAALLLALSCPALAGIMHTPVAAPTPTPTPEATQAAPTMDHTGETEAADGPVEAVLTLLEVVLSLL